jgi:hypothetical protein
MEIIEEEIIEEGSQENLHFSARSLASGDMDDYIEEEIIDDSEFIEEEVIGGAMYPGGAASPGRGNRR